MIPLPSLRTTTNTTLKVTPSRKRKESPTICNGQEAKRPKLSKYGALKPKRRHSTAKMQLNVDTLVNFADKNAGKLPSLRYIMKMLKVGFPKAHEILDEFGIRTGRSKEEIMAAMTVRQENEKKMKKKEKEAHLPSNFSLVLSKLMDTVSGVENWDIFERDYLWNINKLESFIASVTPSMLRLCELHCVVEIATAYYIVAESYYHRRCNIETAYKYIEQSLAMFKSIDNNVFWKEIVSVLILKADILLNYSKDFVGAQSNYELSLNLVERSTHDGGQKAQHEYVIKCLENLTVIHATQRQWVMAIKYGKEFLNRMNLYNIKCGISDTVRVTNIIEVKAWLSCSLMYIHKDEGYKLYREILSECKRRFGAMNTYTNKWICYFAVHFIEINEWNEAHQLMVKILKIDKRYLDDTLKKEMEYTFTNYVEFVNKYIYRLGLSEKRAFLKTYFNKINEIMNVLHDKHIAIICDINLAAKKKQNFYKEINCNYNEDIDLILESKYNYNVDKELYDLYPAINTVSVLISHISLFLNIGSNNGYKILHDLVMKNKCLNKASKYLQFYPIKKISQNEINALLNLL